MEQIELEKRKEQRFFTINETADRFHLHPNMVYELIKKKKLVPNIFGKNAIRISIAEIERYENETIKK